MARNYDDLSREQLIALLQARDKRRFGLVWERDKSLIGVDGSLNDDFVALEADLELSVGAGPWHNILIEGDNYDALRALSISHKGRIKCILIDPPYNTGSGDFIYNDRFLDREHRYRHSVWLEFMFQRLQLAKELLTDDGVIFVCIGEEEVHRLACLMDQVFPGQKVGTFVWRTRSGANDSREYFRSIDHEYVLCYARPGFSFGGQAKDASEYTNPDNDPRGPWLNDNLVKAHNRHQRADAFYPVYNPETDVWYAPDPDSVWRFASEKKLKPGQKLRAKPMEQLIREGKVLWPGDTRTVRYNTLEELLAAIDAGTAPRNLRRDIPDLEFWVGKTIGYGKPRYKRHLSEVKRTEKPFSTWIRPSADKEEAPEDVSSLEVGGTNEGTALLKQILGNKNFPYPKPLSLIQGLLAQATGPDDIVLDFFAGSGTTGHAVLALNAEDGGNRRFILVSSTEETVDELDKNVCRDVCQVRLARVISGYDYRTKDKLKHVEGVPGDFIYLRTKRIPRGKVLTRLSHGRIWTALQMLHCKQINPAQPAGGIWEAGSEEDRLIYLPKADAATLSELNGRRLHTAHATIYAWQPELVAQHVSKAVSVRPVPQCLLERFGQKS
ncbi:MAG: site-specific DNA-methyltransferase [Opitutus sp.]|nr:site-specific DNA-methyltransferase [Opitutus sp.]